jgi:hypothetical protein
VSETKPVYTVGYESVQEPFAATQYKATLYADWGKPRRGKPRGPEPVIETAYGGTKEAAALDLAHRALQQGMRPSAFPKELAGAVLVASEELIERAEEFLAGRFKIRDEALAVLIAHKSAP